MTKSYSGCVPTIGRRTDVRGHYIMVEEERENNVKDRCN